MDKLAEVLAKDGPLWASQTMQEVANVYAIWAIGFAMMFVVGLGMAVVFVFALRAAFKEHTPGRVAWAVACGFVAAMLLLVGSVEAFRHAALARNPRAAAVYLVRSSN